MEVAPHARRALQSAITILRSPRSRGSSWGARYGRGERAALRGGGARAHEHRLSWSPHDSHRLYSSSVDRREATIPPLSSPTYLRHAREWLRAFDDAPDKSAGEEAVTVHAGAGDATVALVVLRNARRRNALSARAMAQFCDAVDALEGMCRGEGAQGPLQAVLVAGDGDTFCAGADLRMAASAVAMPAAGEVMSRVMTDACSRLRALPAPSVALLAGAAVGGGAELSTTCDVRVMHDHARAHVRFVHAKMGLSPGWGGAARLAGIVGRRAALDALLAARRMDARAAAAIGLVDHVCDVEGDEDARAPLDDGALPGEVVEAAAACGPVTAALLRAAWRRCLRAYTAHPPEVIHALKRAVVAADGPALPLGARGAGLSQELEAFRGVWGGDANAAALRRAGVA